MLRLKCAPALPVILAAALLLLPWGWVGAFLAAAAVHELGHVLAVRIFGGKIVEMTLGLHGAQIRTTPMGPKFQLPAILAGPIFGLLPVLLWEKCPRLAFCATLLSAWNLLPIYPLDGGRALRLLLRRNCKWAEWLLLLPASFLLGLLLHCLGLPFWWASLSIPEKLLANFRENGYNRGNTEMR